MAAAGGDYFNEIPDDHIVVNTPEVFRQAVDHLQGEKELGLDAEWVINYGKKPNRIAILQIGTWKCVYIFQIQQLKEVLRRRDWIQFGVKVLGNEKIRKFGYHMVQDLLLLVESVTDLKACFHPDPNILDLRSLEFTMKRKKSDVFSSLPDYRDSEKGLSGLVCALLGRPLDKSDQKSDWEASPLSGRQIFYASVDAYVLLLLQKKMIEIFENSFGDIDYDTFGISAARILSIRPKTRVIWNSRSVTPAIPISYCFRFHTPGTRCRWDVFCWYQHRCWLCFRRHPIYNQCLAAPPRSKQSSPRPASSERRNNMYYQPAYQYSYPSYFQQGNGHYHYHQHW